MAAVEDSPDEGALVADGVERVADFVVDQRVRHAGIAVDPLFDVDRQEDLVEPVGLVALGPLRLLRAVAGQMQVHEIVALNLGSEVGECRLDRRMGRQTLGAGHILGEQRDVFGRKAHRVGHILQQILVHQAGIVLRPDQPVPLRQGRIFSAGDQQRMVGARCRPCPERYRTARHQRRRADKQRPACQFDHIASQARSNFPSETILVEDFVSILNIAPPSNAPVRDRLTRDNNRTVAKTAVRRYLNGIRPFARANSLG